MTLIVYNIADRAVETGIPVWEDVRYITLGDNGALALVSYEGTAPPEVWRIQVNKKVDQDKEEVHLVLQQTYSTQTTGDFLGPSQFG